MFVAFGLLLLVALAAGTFWALKHIQNTYAASEPTTFPEITTAWQEGTAEETEAETPEADTGYDTAPAQRPEAAYVENISPDAAQRWKRFERAANKRQKAQIELNAPEINALLSNNPKLRGKAHVSIRNDVGHVRVSIPLDEVLGNTGWAQSILGVEGRYFNGEATIEPAADGDPAKARISNIRVAGQPVSDDFLDRRVFGMSSIRMAISDWLADQDLQTFDIRNNRVYAETRGR